MRVLVFCVVGVVAVGLAFVQFVAAVALRDQAVAGAWVKLVPEDAARRIEGVDPGLPMPQALLRVLARRAVEEGDLTRADAAIAHLDASAERLALQGNVEEARGDDAAAERAYLDAGDLEDVERYARALSREWQNDRALRLQGALVARLARERTEPDTLALAYYQLGQLEEEAAYRYALRSAPREMHEQRAGAAYQHALAIAPVAERYLLAYGNQLLNLKRYADARAVFVKARDVDATRPEPLVGLGEAALRLGDRAAAKAELANARALDPANDAVVRLAREIGT